MDANIGKVIFIRKFVKHNQRDQILQNFAIWAKSLDIF